ncbi:hypothetical protein ABIA07_002459 [Bradyrhizobium yuanmingense]
MSERMMPCPLMTEPRPAVPRREHDAVAERAEIEVADRAGIKHAVIGQHQRDRRVELAEAAQHPVLPHRLVVACDSHRAEQLLGDVDLPGAMHALVFAVADDVALDLGAAGHLRHVAATHLLQRMTREHMDMPGLGVHRRGRALGALDDRLDHRARHRLVLETTHAAARLDQRLEFHPVNLPARSSGLATHAGCRCGPQNLC